MAQLSVWELCQRCQQTLHGNTGWGALSAPPWRCLLGSSCPHHIRELLEQPCCRTGGLAGLGMEIGTGMGMEKRSASEL